MQGIAYMLAVGLLTLYPSPFSMVASNAYPIYLSGELQQNTANIITTWQKLLKSYLLEIDEEVCTIDLDSNYIYIFSLLVN